MNNLPHEGPVWHLGIQFPRHQCIPIAIVVKFSSFQLNWPKLFGLVSVSNRTIPRNICSWNLDLFGQNLYFNFRNMDPKHAKFPILMSPMQMLFIFNSNFIEKNVSLRQKLKFFLLSIVMILAPTKNQIYIVYTLYCWDLVYLGHDLLLSLNMCVCAFKFLIFFKTKLQNVGPTEMFHSGVKLKQRPKQN